MATIARLSIQDYDRIIETGVFDGRRIELIDGKICQMTPIGAKHEYAVDQLTEWSVLSVASSGVRVRIQQSLGLAVVESVPQPDITWVDKECADRRPGRPRAEDVLLLVEVADTSLDYDLGEKADLYATARIPDYWVVDCRNRRVVVHRQPNSSGYGSVQECSGDQPVAPLSHPHVSLLPENLFRPTNA